MPVLSKKASKKIDLAVENYKAYLRYKAVGPQALTRDQLVNLVRSGKLGKETAVTAPVNEAYLHTHNQMVDNLPAPRQVRDGAVDFLERMMDRYTGKLGDQLKSEVMSTIEGTLEPIADRREGSAIYEALQDPKIWSKNLRKLLNDKVENWEFRYKTIINTELNRASNWGAMDAILHNNPTQEPHEITVFKQGNKPGAGACPECSRFWYLEDGITPRVYRMSELLANGSNIGRKKADWKPTIDSTHPNESHILSELKQGFGFDKGGIEWMSDDHDEFRKQRG